MNSKSENNIGLYTRIFKLSVLLTGIILIVYFEPNLIGQVNKENTTSSKDGFFPVPIMFYLPSTGYALGGAFLYYNKPISNNPERFPNIIGGFATYSTKEQIQIGARANFYFGENDFRYDLDAAFFRTPTEFWGIGEPTQSEDVTYNQYRIKMDFLFALKKDFYLGPFIWYENFDLYSYETGGMIDTLNLLGSMGVVTSSLGALIAIENRDSLFFPTKGSYIEVKGLLYRKYFGSDVEFSRIDVDLRYYVSFIPGQVVAFNSIVNITKGDVPLQMMPKLGNYQMMRGYPMGKYTDKSLWAIQSEYRLPLFWKMGVSAFVGIGQVAPDISLFNINDIKIAMGYGLRYLLDKAQHLNVRLDVAHSVEGTFVYFTIQEAF